MLKYMVTRLPLSSKVTSIDSSGYSDLIMVHNEWLLIDHYLTVAGQCRTFTDLPPQFKRGLLGPCAAHPGGKRT